MGVTDKNADRYVCCHLYIVIFKCNNHRLHQHSMIIVPMDTKGVKKIRPMTVFGYNGKRILSYLYT